MRLGHLVIGLTKSSNALVVRGNGLVKMIVFEIGPKDIREIQLGVGHLPDEKVADALLPTCANEQIGLWQVGGACPARFR